MRRSRRRVAPTGAPRDDVPRSLLLQHKILNLHKHVAMSSDLDHIRWGSFV